MGKFLLQVKTKIKIKRRALLIYTSKLVCHGDLVRVFFCSSRAGVAAVISGWLLA
jgi:hypothetical protein